MNRETPRNKYDKAQEHDQGIRERSGWCSSLRLRGGRWVTMILMVLRFQSPEV